MRLTVSIAFAAGACLSSTVAPVSAVADDAALRARADAAAASAQVGADRLGARGGGPSLSGGGTEAGGTLRYQADLFALLSEDALRSKVKSLEFGAWSSGFYRYSGNPLDGAAGAGALRLGVDRKLGPRRLVGLLAQTEFATEGAGADGFLIGPYAALPIGAHVRFDMTALVGALEATASEASRQTLGRAHLGAGAVGGWRFGRIGLNSTARVDYYLEPGEDAPAAAGRIMLRPEISYAVSTERTAVRPFVSLEGAYRFDEAAIDLDDAPTVAGGVETRFGAAALTGRVTYDADAAGAVGAGAEFRLPFN